MKQVQGWTPLLIVDAAREFFKAALRPEKPDGVLSWALEWNKNYRAIGYAGDPDAIRSYVDNLPPLEMMPLASSPQGTLHMRAEQRLKISDDVMFRRPESSENDPVDGAI
jgi:hypothetical protein